MILLIFSVAAVYPFIETICQVPAKCRALHSSVYCPYRVHSNSRGRPAETKKEQILFRVLLRHKGERGHFYVWR